MTLKYSEVFLITIITAAFFCSATGAAVSSEEEETTSEFTEALKEFIKLVETHHLNVTVIRSNQKYYSNGNAKSSAGMAIHLPTNNVVLTEPTLTKESTVDFGKKVIELSKRVDLAADIRKVKVTNGESDKVPTTVVESNRENIIKSLNYDHLLRVKDEEKGFFLDEFPTYEILYNYIITGEDGKTKNVKILTSHVDIKVLKKSDDFKDEDVEAIKKIVPEYYMTTDDDNLYAKRIGQHLDEKLTTNCNNYQIMTGVDKDFWLSTKHYLLLDVAGTNLLIYCFPKK